MADQDTFSSLLLEIARLFLPLRVAVSSPERFTSFMARLGWRVEKVPAPLHDLGSGLDTLITELEKVLDGDISEAGIDRLRQAVVDVINAIQQISAAPDAQFPPHLLADNFKKEFPAQLVTYLVAEYLSTYHPAVAFALRALGVIQVRYQAPAGQRKPFIRYTFQLSALPQVLDNPSVVFRNAYGWGTDEVDYETIFEQLDSLLVYLGVTTFIAPLDENIAALLEEGVDVPGDPQRRVLKAVFFERIRTNGERMAAELDLLPLPGNATLKPGLALLPFFNGPLDFSMQLGEEIAVKIGASFDVAGGVGLILRPDKDINILLGFDNPSLPTKAEGELTVRAEYSSQSRAPIVLVGSRDGSRLEVQSVSGLGGLRLSTSNNTGELFTELDLQGGHLVIALAQGDSFLQQVLPANGLDARLELTVGMSNLRGFYFRGSGSLEIQLPAHVNLGFAELQALTIGMRPNAGTIPVSLGANVKVELGPLTAVVENMGLTAIFSFPDDNHGNLGPLQFDVGFKPPDGIGLSIEGGGFTGGGFLRHIAAEERYEGILELEYEDKLSLKAIGLLATQLPGGKPGFSLLIIITAEFTPVQLGLGFTLNGVGGLLGLNRTADAERLRSGLRDNTLSSVLFPQNVIENASRILSDLNQVFPPQSDRFIFGPMARIGWGTPTLLTIDLGLLIEIPDPVRVLILGVIRALLPDEHATLLQIQVNFLGVIDFQAQRLSLDASLYDSKLLTYTLSGDMAVRVLWGSEPNFLLTVGGFHPAFQPPPLNLPTLRRLSLQLVAGDNPRIKLETYFAITSNTVQFGAKAELLARAGSFSIYGFVSFDVLFQFNPFYFIAAISAKLALRAGDSEIASVSLDFTLEGPTPWHAKGTAKLKICWFLTIKVHFDKTFGEERDTRLDDVPVLPLLQAALSDENNWEAQFPDNRHLLVTFKKIEVTGAPVVVPFGVLAIQQRVVPLGIEIQRFGSQKPADGDRFAIEKVTVGEGSQVQALTVNPVSELFAPAQFFELPDAQKLASKSFERYDSGVKLVDSEAFDGDYAVRREVTYELIYIDAQRNLHPRQEPLPPDFTSFFHWAQRGAVASSPLSHARNGKSSLAPGAVRVSQEGFAVVNASDLRPVEAAAQVASEAGAQRLMAQMVRNDPALDGEILVVPAFEVNRS